MAQNKLMTTDNLIKEDGQFRASVIYVETRKKLLNTYSHSVNILCKLNYGHTITFTTSFTQGEMQEIMREQGGTKLKQIYITKCFVIWRERCTRIFREIYKTPQQIKLEITEEVQSWFQQEHFFRINVTPLVLF
jgi:hypothetical protein